ncbi:MAG TPA: GGDEF domain-containing protein [Stenomitos sp.]
MTTPSHVRQLHAASAQTLAVHELAVLLADHATEQASYGAFEGLAALLLPNPEPDAYDALADAARRMTGAEAAWLLVPEDEHEWLVLGRSMSAVAFAEAFTPESRLRIVHLSSEDEIYGTLAFWPADGEDDAAHGLEEAFEHALAAALRTRKALDESRHLSTTDPLTDLPNRRAFDTSISRMMALARRNQRPLSVLMLDLDHFKHVNDAYGHDAGDEVLKAFATTLLGCVRASDLPVRYGGEEFLVVLPETRESEALEVAEKIRLATQRLAIPVACGVVHPTVSIGVTGMQPHDTPESLVSRADKALYRAKASGRNCCRIEST